MTNSRKFSNNFCPSTKFNYFFSKWLHVQWGCCKDRRLCSAKKLIREGIVSKLCVSWNKRSGEINSSENKVFYQLIKQRLQAWHKAPTKRRYVSVGNLFVRWGSIIKRIALRSIKSRLLDIAESMFPNYGISVRCLTLLETYLGQSWIGENTCELGKENFVVW